MTDLPECSCPHMADLARMSLEGHDVSSCPIHRPDRGHGETLASAPALNSDALAHSIAARLGATETATL